MLWIYTDGAYSPRDASGGWGCVAFCNGKEAWRLSGSVNETTNNRMELLAILQGLSKAMRDGSDNVIVITDSQYSRNAVLSNSERSNHGAVKNSDLIKQIKSVLQTIGNVKIDWVRGHSGVPGNELADKLATAARDGKTLE